MMGNVVLYHDRRVSRVCELNFMLLSLSVNNMYKMCLK